MRPSLVIFTGLPGTGKTILSRKIASVLGLPLIAKDDIKEIMYDEIGWSDKAFSAKLAHATFGIMDYVTEEHLKNGLSLMLESNYSPRLSNDKFQAWQKRYDCGMVQIVCRADANTLAHRYFERQHTNRHPGHNDNGTVASYRDNFKQRIKNGEDEPLHVHGAVRVVDTTDFSTVNAEEIAKWVESRLGAD